MSEDRSDNSEATEGKAKGKPWFFIGIIGGIILGSMFGNIGAGVAIGICLWLLMSAMEKKDGSSKPDVPIDEEKD
ncbi:hypothetical protein [Wenzhouxiangella marina]|uniref:Uncharacterized protein n=1 Tax=Wenzhouxiangella marina TaxID=1579979 RepID=A0A0K0XUH7_9GAMM|nr:hypothetical protein [Wenzhouxiangella marina]AKS41271.1 hypothetical protein WM2015_890 [Wenzhouxiangella marina]MBB6086979.1 NhaP-type Na+/H+ or K+/H+ antiporter [Wenzhouxiangella marina]